MNGGSDQEKAVTAHLRHIRLEGKSPMTVRDRELNLARLARWLAQRDIGSLLGATADDLYEWRAALDGKVKPATVACYASNILSFYNWAVGEGLLDVNPADDIPVPPVPRRLPHPISEKDYAHAVNTAPGWLRLAFVLAGGAGLRAKEISRLRADNIRLSEEVPHLRIVHDATKGHTERHLPLAAWVIAELGRASEAGYLYPSGLVFRKANGRPLGDYTVSNLCNQHLRAVGIADSLHSCRHRFLTRAYEVHRDLKAAQALAGHAHISTTAGYAAIDGAALVRTVNAIPSPLGTLRNQEAS